MAQSKHNWNSYWNNWKWRIHVEKVDFFEWGGSPRVIPIKEVGIIFTTTQNREQEEELLYTLTSPNSILQQALSREGDGWYRLAFFKQTPSAKMMNLPVFGYYGYALITKRKDIIFWETKYLQVGKLNAYNLQTRDVQEEIRRGHIRDIPSGGVDPSW